MDILSSSLKKQADRETSRYIRMAEDIYGRDFPLIETRYDLRGSASGQFQASCSEELIRYNPYIFARHFEYCLGNTVPHEVAHHIMHQVHGMRGVRPHGIEWRSLMLQFGVEPRRTNTLNLNGLPIRRQRCHLYHCDCRSHELTSTRHNRIMRDGARYFCRLCKAELKPQG